MSKERDEVTKGSSQPIVLRAMDPKTMSLIHQYLDQNKGKDLHGKPIVKLRRYVRKPGKLEASPNVYSFKDAAGNLVQIALDESVIIFNAEDAKTRKLYILKNKFGSGGYAKVKSVLQGSVDFSIIQAETGKERVLKIVPYTMGATYTAVRSKKEEVIRLAQLEEVFGESAGCMFRESSIGNKAYLELPRYPGEDLYTYYRKITDLDEKIDIVY